MYNSCKKIIADINCNTIVNQDDFDAEYVYIYILLLNKTSGKTISQTFIKENSEDQIKFTIGLDGFYTLCKIKVPLDSSKPYYYKEGRLYKGNKLTNLSEVLNVNPEVSQLEINYYYYFLLCKLKKCYFNIASKIINSKASISCKNSEISQDELYKRDLLMTSINVLNYLSEMRLFEEAERILEKISGCNGLCNLDKTNNCGCGK